MPRCKKCNSDRVTKSGKANGKQRFYCKGCGCHFTDGDGRTNERVTIKKAMCVVLHTLGKASFRTLARVFNTSPSLTYRWVDEAGCKSHSHDIKGTTKQMTFDELCKFIKTTEASFDTSKPLTVASGELWQGYPAIVILQQSADSKVK
ncbi:MAG: hypothetical protein FWE97_02115 [Dehalococcoidia bacterium]|nr:hypothetical protein [Dehalococcoidia bacterium]